MTAIVNIGVGSWYPQGQARLRSYCDGFPLEFTDELPPGYPKHDAKPYMMKILWVSRALQRHSRILWLDCSVVPTRPLADFVEYIEGHPFTKAHGVYAYRTGMTLGETCNDRAFEISGLPEACLAMPEFASTIFYIDKTKNAGRDVAYWCEMLARRGAIKGSREHDPKESPRPEFKFHRQDQTCLTLAMCKAGIAPHGSDGLWDVVRYSEEPLTNDRWAVVAGGWENLKCYPCASGAG